MKRRRKPCPKAPRRPKVLPGDLYNCNLPFLGEKVAINHRDPARSIAGTVQGCRKNPNGRGAQVIVGKTFATGTVRRALGLAKPRAKRARAASAHRAPSTEIVLARPRMPMFLPRAAELPRYMVEPRAMPPVPLAPRPMLALPAPAPVAAPAVLAQPPVKSRTLRLSQVDREFLARTRGRPLRTDNLSSGEMKVIASLKSRGLMRRASDFFVELTDDGETMSETMDEVRASPGTKSYSLITAEPTYMAAMFPEPAPTAPPPRAPTPPPAPPSAGARALSVTAAPPAFDVRPSVSGGKVQHYSLWERVTMPDGSLAWVERPWIANDAETLRDDIPEKMAQRLAATRASGYSIAAYDRLVELLHQAFDARGVPPRPEGRARAAKELATAIVTGKYTTALDPANKITRDVFARFTGIELPKGVTKTMALFTGQPFHVVVSLTDDAAQAPAPPAFDEKEWRRFYYGLAGKLLAAAQADVAAARKVRNEGLRYEADRQVQAAMLLRKLAADDDTPFATFHATWHATWNDVGIPLTPAGAMSQPVSPLPAGMKPNRRPGARARRRVAHARW